MTAWLEADWPVPPGVRALATTRHGLGVSQPPFDSFNLGLRNGDDPEAAMENRRRLEATLALPSPPRWLRQVHGTNVFLLPARG
jgi:copper oxidase (laccase) domain-containing protein